jgi:hypothetical protein
MTVRWFHMSAAFALAGLAAGSIALAAPKMQSTPVPQPPKPDFSSMSWMVGTWNCSFRSSRRPAAISSTSVVSMDPTGFWMITKTSTKPASYFPYASQMTDWTTYDRDTSRWVDLATGSFGAYSVSTSPGWSGNTITWTDALFKPTSDVMAETPTVNTKVSASKWTSHYTFQERSDKQWVTVNTACTKSM